MMQAEKMLVHTDAQGQLIEHPNLPPNATLEALYLVTSTEQPGVPPEPKPSPAEVARRLAAEGIGVVFGDPLEWQRQVRRDRPLPGCDSTAT